MTSNQTQKFKLKNGLTVILKQHKRAPIVSIQMGVRVGSVYESNAEAGLCHLIEHMVFKGTPTYKPGEIAGIIESSGGDLNAYTSFDQTVYYVSVLKKHFSLGLNVIKEMSFEALMDPIEIEREKEVVIEEVRRGLDQPSRVISQNLFSLCYPEHHYGRPIIGYEKTVRGFSPAKIKSFYQKWYNPKNMILGVCGDIDLNKAKKLIKKSFEDYRGSPPKQTKTKTKAQSTKLKTPLIAKDKVESYYLNLAFPTVSLNHKDTVAIDLISHFLGDGETSLLYQKIKEQLGLVNSIGSYSYTPKYDGVLIIEAQYIKDNTQEIVDQILKAIDFLRKNKIDVQDLTRVRNQILSSRYYRLQTCEGIVSNWMSYETTVSDYAFDEKYMARLTKISTDDILKTAQKYLDPKKLKITVLQPDSNPKVKLKNPTVNAAQKIKAPVVLRSKSKIDLHKLANGMKLITLADNDLPLISAQIAGLGGLRAETLNQSGLAHLTYNVLEKGTQNQSALEIAKTCESIAGHVQSYSGKNSWGVKGSFLSSYAKTGFDLLTQMIKAPLFSQTEFEKEKKLQLESIKSKKDSPAYLAFEKFQALLYPKHKYGHPQLGFAKDVNKINRNNILDFYKAQIQPQDMVICVGGKIDKNQVYDHFNEELGSLKKTQKQNINPGNVNPISKKQIRQIIQKKNQAHLVLGFLGPKIHHKEKYAFEVLNSILTGQSGRLFLHLRDEQSLAYAVTSYLVQGIEPGYFAAYIGCHHEKLKLAYDGILNELKTLQTTLVPKPEMERAKNFLIGSFESGKQKVSSKVSQLLSNELFGLSWDEYFNYSQKINQVKADQVQEIAKKYFDFSRLTMAVVSPLKKNF